MTRDHSTCQGHSSRSQHCTHVITSIPMLRKPPLALSWRRSSSETTFSEINTSYVRITRQDSRHGNQRGPLTPPASFVSPSGWQIPETLPCVEDDLCQIFGLAFTSTAGGNCAFSRRSVKQRNGCLLYDSNTLTY